MSNEVLDMNGIEIKVGDTVRKYSIIKDKNSSFKIATVKYVAPMHDDGESMIWAGGGGAHHPLACEVVSEH